MFPKKSSLPKEKKYAESEEQSHVTISKLFLARICIKKLGNMGNWETRACKWRQDATLPVSQFCDIGKQMEFNWETILWEKWG